MSRPPSAPPPVAYDADQETAERLRVSKDALLLVRACELIDLHIDTFIPVRLWGYQALQEHPRAPLGGYFFGHLDLQRALQGGLTGGMWSITTNPLRTASGRWTTLLRNIQDFKALVDSSLGALRLVRDYAEFSSARAAGAHCCLLSLQGANALGNAPDGIASVPGNLVTRVTLVHLTNNEYGASSSPASVLRRHRGLSPRGRELVRQLNVQRVFVDLAHIHPQGFWDAVSEHDPSQPLIVTHTGVKGVRAHWRNLDDKQIEAIAQTGGTIGVMFHAGFLRRPLGPRDGRMVLEHMQHIIDVVGEDYVSIGSDYDGAIIPPGDLRSGDSYPRLVQYMLDQGWSEKRIRKILGENFLRAFRRLRPGTAPAADLMPPSSKD